MTSPAHNTADGEVVNVVWTRPRPVAYGQAPVFHPAGQLSVLKKFMSEKLTQWALRGDRASGYAQTGAERLLNDLGITSPDHPRMPKLDGTPHGALDLYWRRHGRNLIVHIPASWFQRAHGNAYAYTDGSAEETIVEHVPNALELVPLLDEVYRD